MDVAGGLRAQAELGGDGHEFFARGASCGGCRAAVAGGATLVVARRRR